jgi:hypothetical protein
MELWPLLLENPGLLAVLAFALIACLVLGLSALLMLRRGLSLRPLAWLAGFFLLVVGPQAGVHLSRALAPPPAVSGEAAAPGPERPSGAPRTAAQLAGFFGADASRAKVTDAAPMFRNLKTVPRWSRFAVFPGGQTALAAEFESAAEAERAALGYLALSGLDSNAEGDTARGFRGTRPAGDRVFVRNLGQHLRIWSAPDDAGLTARVAASGSHWLSGGPEGGAAALAFEDPPFGLSWPEALGLLLAYVLLVSVYFLKGAAWAAAIPARPVAPLAESVLRERLLAVNGPDTPIAVSPGRHRDEIVVDWRYADARWLDHARAHAARRTHRLVLRLDEARRSVRVREYQTRLEGSAGRGGAGLAWSFVSGIVFFQAESERVFGVQLDERGRPRGDWSHAWRFDSETMKAPFVEMVTQAGWHWRPLVWDAPAGLRWLAS